MPITPIYLCPTGRESGDPLLQAHPGGDRYGTMTLVERQWGIVKLCVKFLSQVKPRSRDTRRQQAARPGTGFGGLHYLRRTPGWEGRGDNQNSDTRRDSDSALKVYSRSISDPGACRVSAGSFEHSSRGQHRGQTGKDQTTGTSVVLIFRRTSG